MELHEASSQWASRPADERFEKLDDLLRSVTSRRLRSRSTDIDLNRTEVKVSDGTLTINGTIAPSEPSHWAFGQFSSWVGAPAAYLRKLSPELVAQNLNYGIQRAGNESLKFMTIAPESEGSNRLQAVTSTTYGRIWDADVALACQRIVERSSGRFYNPKAMVNGQARPSGLYASDHDIFIFMIDGGSVLDIGPRAQMNRGFFMWNSETGAKTWGLCTFLFNHVCGNHIIWGAEDVNRIVIRHTQNGPARFDSEGAPALLAYCNSSAKPQEECVRKAQAKIIGNDDTEVATYALEHGKFSKPEVKSAIDFSKAEEGECKTLWQLVQGLTAYARGFDFIDARVDLETRAGKLLSAVES